MRDPVVKSLEINKKEKCLIQGKGKLDTYLFNQSVR